MIAIYRMDYGILRLICIVYHTIFSVFYISMYFYVYITAKPLIKFCFTTSTPKNTSVKNAAVFKTI